MIDSEPTITMRALAERLGTTVRALQAAFRKGRLPEPAHRLPGKGRVFSEAEARACAAALRERSEGGSR